MKQIVSETAILNKKNSLQYLKLNLPNQYVIKYLSKFFTLEYVLNSWNINY